MSIDTATLRSSVIAAIVSAALLGASSAWAAECSLAPLAGCRETSTSSLRLTAKRNPEANLLKFRWLRGEAISGTEFGNPSAGTEYALCVYDTIDDGGDGVDFLALEIVISAGTDWSKGARVPGWIYDDLFGAESGINFGRLRRGSAGHARVAFRGTEENLPVADRSTNEAVFFDADFGVTAQVINDKGLCITTTFGSSDIGPNARRRFRSRTD